MTNQLSDALRRYTGRGSSAFPLRTSDGVEGGYPVIAAVEGLLSDLGRLQPDWKCHSLQSATEWAKAEMKARHPELDQDALDTLGWVFSYDWK